MMKILWKPLVWCWNFVAKVFEFMHSPFTVISKEVDGKVEYGISEDFQRNSDKNS